MIPGNSTVLAASWVFICASVFLLVEFIALYHGPYQELYYKCTGADALPSGGCKRAAWASDNTINVLGALEGVGWFIGFALLIDWIVFHTFPVWGASRRTLVGATLKLIAAVLFNVQPWSALIDKEHGLQGVGVPWSNFAGICFFHSGNCLDALGMTFLFDRKTPFCWANMPVWGMWSFCLATWFLVVADGAAYFNYPHVPGAYFGPPAAYTTPHNLNLVAPCQIIGASLLLLGSVIYTMWATFVPRPSVKDIQSTLLPS